MEFEIIDTWKVLDLSSKGIPAEFINSVSPTYRDVVLREHLINPSSMLDEWDDDVEEALNSPEGFKEFLEDLKKVQDANDAFYIRFIS